jgi:hypothetical protein
MDLADAQPCFGHSLTKNYMKKVILVYGLISGTIAAALLMGTMSLYESETLPHENGEIIGYSGMLISLSLIFFGIKSLRDNHLGGSITFWKGSLVGLLIALIASSMYALGWEITYQNMDPEFFQKLMGPYYESMKAGLSGAALEEKEKEIARFIEYYKNPVIRFGMSLVEILPVGIVLTLISAGLLRKKEFLPASNNQQSVTTK